MLPTLETARFSLQELGVAHAPELQPWQSAPPQWRMQAVEPNDFADAGERIGNYLKHRGSGAQRRLYAFAARRKSDGALIACGSLARSHPQIASLGLSVAHSQTGQGYGAELARRLLTFGFGEIGLNRVEADVAQENFACIRLMEKIGMQREGLLREATFAQGRWWSEAKYAMLASDLLSALQAAPISRNMFDAAANHSQEERTSRP